MSQFNQFLASEDDFVFDEEEDAFGWHPVAPAFNGDALPSETADVSSEKACQILSDGSVHGQELTEDQRGMFGAICGERKATTNVATPAWVAEAYGG